jgi:type I restriction enzyme, S subunit
VGNCDGCERVKFGDVVRNVSETVADPVAAGVERAVGLEDLEPGKLALTSWASTREGFTFTRRFRAGQVLFGRRRAYQRKVSVPEFDGVCSGDIYVFEPSDTRLLPDLLPFIVQSKSFFEHALRTSAGSLSPRTKWTDLRNYEFELPGVDRQREISNLLWAADATRRSSAALLTSMRAARRVFVNANVTYEGADAQPLLGELLDVCQYGLSLAASEDGTIPLLRMNNVTAGSVDLSDLKQVTLSEAELESYRLADGDVLFNRTNSVDLVGRTGIYHGDGDVVFASYLIRLRPKQDLLPKYLNLFLNSDLGQNRVRARLTKGVSQANISGSSLKKVSIPLPPRAEQQRILDQVAILDGGIAAMKHQCTLGDHLYRGLLTELL